MKWTVMTSSSSSLNCCAPGREKYDSLPSRQTVMKPDSMDSEDRDSLKWYSSVLPRCHRANY